MIAGNKVMILTMAAMTFSLASCGTKEKPEMMEMETEVETETGIEATAGTEADTGTENAKTTEAAEPESTSPWNAEGNIRSLDQGKKTSRAIKGTKQHHTRKMRQLLNRKIHERMEETTDMGLRNTRRHRRRIIHRILLQLQHRRRDNGHGLRRLQSDERPRKYDKRHATSDNQKLA